MERRNVIRIDILTDESQLPAADSQQPAASSSQQPAANCQQPAAGSEQPAAGSQQRAASRQHFFFQLVYYVAAISMSGASHMQTGVEWRDFFARGPKPDLTQATSHMGVQVSKNCPKIQNQNSWKPANSLFYGVEAV
jgi:hypothetical protein